jgi:hypothetical protein
MIPDINSNKSNHLPQVVEKQKKGSFGGHDVKETPQVKVDKIQNVKKLKLDQHPSGDETAKLMKVVKAADDLKSIDKTHDSFTEIIRLKAEPSTTKAIDVVLKLLKEIEAFANPSTLLDAVNGLSLTHQESIEKDPHFATSLHELYNKIAEKLVKEGKIEEAFAARSQAAEIITFSSLHPLYHLEGSIQKSKNMQAQPEFGAHFSGFDTGIIKGSTISARIELEISRRGMEKTKKQVSTNLHFRVSHIARSEIGNTIEIIKANKSAFEQSLPEGLKGHPVTISEIEHSSIPGRFGKAIQVDFGNVGKVIIGNSEDWKCYFNDVSVKIPAGNEIPGGGLKAFHQMLTVLGCGPIACIQRPQDDERIKIAQLFRAFYPKEAFKLETSQIFFNNEVTELIAIIKEKVPKMEMIFQHYLVQHPELMKKEEIYPGKNIWTVTDLGDKIRERGGLGLMSGVSDVLNIAKILKIGHLSSKDRFEAGLVINGASSEEDLTSGGGGEVFTRMLTKELINKEIFDEDGDEYFLFAGKAQILYDLDVLNRVSYGYTTDAFGEKSLDSELYQNRKSLIDFAGEKLGGSNEVMIKNRIDPKYIRGVVVQTLEQKDALIQDLQNEGLLPKKINDKTRMLGKSLSEFITVANKFNESMWSKGESI